MSCMRYRRDVSVTYSRYRDQRIPDRISYGVYMRAGLVLLAQDEQDQQNGIEQEKCED